MVADQHEQTDEFGTACSALLSIPGDDGPATAGFVGIDESGEWTTLTYEDLPGPWVFDVVATRGMNGKVVIAALTVRQRDRDNPQSINSTRLRSAPIGTLLERVRSAMSVPAHKRVPHLMAQKQTHLPKVGRSHPDAHYLQVGWFSAFAENTNRPPRQVIADHWNVTKATASRWRRKARELGYVPEHNDATQGGKHNATAANFQTEWTAMQQATEEMEIKIFQKVLTERILPVYNSGSPQQEMWVNDAVKLITGTPLVDDEASARYHEALFFRMLAHLADADGATNTVRTAARVLAVGLAPRSDPHAARGDDQRV